MQHCQGVCDKVNERIEECENRILDFAEDLGSMDISGEDVKMVESARISELRRNMDKLFCEGCALLDDAAGGTPCVLDLFLDGAGRGR